MNSNPMISYFIASLTLCGLVFAGWIGGYEWFLNTGWLDISMCLFIFLVAVGHYIWAFYRPDIAWIGADNCISLGLLGTVIGLLIALPNVKDIEVATAGIAMALLTTGVGLVCNLLLYNHGYYLGLSEEEQLQ